MKILVFAHRLEIGGTQVNAIELSAALRDHHGHEITLFATPGPMLDFAREKNLRFLPAPEANRHPSPRRIQALRSAVRSERPDLIHVWDWWQCLEAYYGVHLPLGIPLVASDMMMNLTRLMPRGIPTTFGTPELVDQARQAGHRLVELILPPVDVDRNKPGAVDGRALRAQLGIRADEIALVTVSRLAHHMKGASLFDSIDAVGALGQEFPLRLVLIGEGAARAELTANAEEVNARLGRAAVLLPGPLLDARPAYAAADIVIGMGGSALRALAFAKPVVITGENGFARPFTRATSGDFYYRGMYGRGAGDHQCLARSLRELLDRRREFDAIGAFSRNFVLEHFALAPVAARLNAFLSRAREQRQSLPSLAGDGLRTAGLYLRERRFLTRSS